MTKEDKRAYFHQISGKRLQRILDDLDSLGNCSKPSVYDYDPKELLPIFTAITSKVNEVRCRLQSHSPHSGIPFRLAPSGTLLLAGHKVCVSNLVTFDEVMKCLEENGSCFTSMEPIRNQYEANFGDELCWGYPIPHGTYLGCVLLPVQEGIAYLPYSEIAESTYEQFDLCAAGLLTSDLLEQISPALQRACVEWAEILLDIQASGIVQDRTVLPKSEVASKQTVDRQKRQQRKELLELKLKLSEALNHEPADSGDENEDEVWKQANYLLELLEELFAGTD